MSLSFHPCCAFFVVPQCGLSVSPPTRPLGPAGPIHHLLTPWGCSRVASGLGIRGSISGSGSLLRLDCVTLVAWVSFLWASPARPAELLPPALARRCGSLKLRRWLSPGRDAPAPGRSARPPGSQIVATSCVLLRHRESPPRPSGASEPRGTGGSSSPRTSHCAAYPAICPSAQLTPQSRGPLCLVV